jgi:hypothetical protein
VSDDNAFDLPFAATPDHQGDRRGNNGDMIFIHLTFLISIPVHKEPVPESSFIKPWVRQEYGRGKAMSGSDAGRSYLSSKQHLLSEGSYRYDQDG